MKLDILTHILTSLLSYIVPKKKGYLAFVSFQFYGKYSGNNKYLFEYMLHNKDKLPDGVALAYVTDLKNTEAHIKALGYPVKRNRILWTWDLLRAEMIITDGSRAFFGLGKFKFVQLWHGTGYKNIGLSYEGKSYSKTRSFLQKRFFKQMVFVSATSESDQTRKAKAFNSDAVYITGSSRNDLLLNNTITQKNNFNKTFLYASTFRDTGGEFTAMPDKAWEELNEIMKRTNSQFLIKKHPSDYKLKVPTHFSNIKDVTAETEDIQELLAVVDVLITDYSGIASDFVLTEQPIIFYTYDFDEYMANNRTFYYDLKEALPGPFANNSDELLKFIEDLDWFNEPSYQVKYNAYKNLFHKFIDANSTERTLNKILEIYNKN